MFSSEYSTFNLSTFCFYHFTFIYIVCVSAYLGTNTYVSFYVSRTCLKIKKAGTLLPLPFLVRLEQHFNPRLFRRLVFSDISGDKLLDLRGRRRAVGFAGSLVGFQHVWFQVQRETDVVLAQILDLRFVL